MIKLPKLRDGLLQKIRLIAYGIAAILVSIAWILTIAVLTKSGTTGSATKFYFFLTWISFPAFLYLAVAPLWPRTQKFVNVYATTALDVAFAIFWLSAFCAVQVWTDSGIKDNLKGCSDFEYGDESKCNISHATAIMGVIVFILWLIAAVISVYSLIYFRKNGTMPNIRLQISKPTFDECESKAGYNHTTIRPQTRLHTRLNRGRQDEEHGSVHTETEEGTHPGRPLSWGQEPPLTAPPTYNQSGIPVFRPVQYVSEPSEETNNFRQSFLAPRRNRQPPGALPLHPAIHRYNSNIGNPFAQDGSSFATGNGQAPYNTLREFVRQPLPGPASLHAGGYNSAFHTPLPPGMGPGNNSWRDDQEVGTKSDGKEGGRLAFPPADYSR